MDHAIQQHDVVHGGEQRTGLGQRMRRAGMWLLGSSMASQGLRLISSLVLTRLLVPESFGLVAAVQTVYFALVMFSDVGVWQVIVTNPRSREERFLGTAMSIQLMRAVILASVVVLTAVALALGAKHQLFAPNTVYDDPRLPWMMAAFGLVALLQGAESMHLATAQRDLNARLLTRLELVSQVTGSVVTIALAVASQSVWSLVAGTFVATACRTVLSHVWLPGERFRPCWDAVSAGQIFFFGKWVFLSSIVGFVAANGEKLVLGAILPAATFGLFSIAATLLAAVSGLVGTMNAHLIFPGLSQALRTGPTEAAEVYARLQRLADLALGLTAGVILFAGGWAVRGLYDARYVEAAWMLQVLGLGLLAIRYQVLEQMMFALGSPAWVTGCNAARALTLAIAIPAGYAIGGERGAVLAVVASQFAGWPIGLWFKYRHGLLSLRSEAAWPVSLAIGALLGWGIDLGLRSLFAS